jgi:hypothetical protein
VTLSASNRSPGSGADYLLEDFLSMDTPLGYRAELIGDWSRVVDHPRSVTKDAFVTLGATKDAFVAFMKLGTTSRSGS